MGEFLTSVGSVLSPERDSGEVHIYSAFQTRSWLRPWL